MKVVALVSGGKDSCYAMMKCLEYGHEVVALANLMPSDDLVDELDSYMYQTVGHQIVVNYAKCMGLPLFRRRIQGSSRYQNLSYQLTPGDEVEDMFILLNEVKRQIPSVGAVSSGAIASDYQRHRVESVCSRLGLVSLAYLWKQDQSLLLQEMVSNGIKAIIVKVAALGLDPNKHLGQEISILSPYLHKLKEMYGINVCGEGGEYETLTLDCPLFVNARILVDDYKVILHSSDSIAPVGVLHPLRFHLEKKDESVTSTTDGLDTRGDVCLEETESIFEVQGDCLQSCEDKAESANVPLAELRTHDLYISRTNGENAYSICCMLHNVNGTSTGLQEDLLIVLKRIELQLMETGSNWENVLYIHLYIDNMNDFALANESYMKIITLEKCLFGVPSRSTIELPLLQVGLGRAYVEVLVGNSQKKRVLHVQSNSCWAPSCIGPYSQATLHNEILHMAGQLGLDPPTMTLCMGGTISELKLALQNSEAVANCFKGSVSTSAFEFVFYCSTHAPLSERAEIQKNHDMFLNEMRSLLLDEGNIYKVLKPVSLYVLVPNLPKRASVEVKPILYIEHDTEYTTGTGSRDLSCFEIRNYWGFQPAPWHDYCFQKCAVPGKLCAIIVHITNQFASQICLESSAADEKAKDWQNFITDGQTETVARFCIYLLDRVLLENDFLWTDTMNLRIYYPTSLCIHLQTLVDIFDVAFKEFSEMSKRLSIGEVPIFNIIPVLQAGRSSASMEDMITCELLAVKDK